MAPILPVRVPFLSLVFACALTLAIPESQLPSCCHHQHPSRSLRMLSGMLLSCGNNSTTVVEPFRRAAPSACEHKCMLFLRYGAMFIITVYLIASAKRSPEARSQSPTSSSQSRKPDSKPSAVVPIRYDQVSCPQSAVQTCTLSRLESVINV